MSKTRITKQDYGPKKDILLHTGNGTAPLVALSVMVNSQGVTARNESGKKYIPAGSALTADRDVYLYRDEVMTLATADEAQGVTQHDIVFDSDVENANLITEGYIDISKIDEAARPTEDIAAALLEGKSRVIFGNGENN